VRYTGLLLDFGGVLTTDLVASVDAWCERQGIGRERMVEVLASDPVGRRLYHQIERGEISQTTFEQGLAERLGVDGGGLLRALLASARPNPEMIRAALRARRAGIRVGMVSNSWGLDPYNPYEDYRLSDWFDAVVISGEVGLRKPEPAIYQLAVAKLAVPASACVFVDDLEPNLAPARALGMATVHHVQNAATIPQLERLLGTGLR
jgi:putative hydrolase of the HAD superfamily